MVNILLFKQSPVAKKLLKSYSNYLLTLESFFMDKIIYSNVFIDFNFKGYRK